MSNGRPSTSVSPRPARSPNGSWTATCLRARPSSGRRPSSVLGVRSTTQTRASAQGIPGTQAPERRRAAAWKRCPGLRDQVPGWQGAGMAVLQDTVFDAQHPASLARFWAGVLDGYHVAPYDEAELQRLRSIGVDDVEDDPTVLVESPDPLPRFWFQKVPEAKTTKNRVHRDLRADDTEAEICPLAGTGRRPRSLPTQRARADLQGPRGKRALSAPLSDPWCGRDSSSGPRDATTTVRPERSGWAVVRILDRGRPVRRSPYP